MSKFKEIVKEDIKNIFLNFDEFGEYHLIGKRSFLVIVDENELTEREKRIKGDDLKGLHTKQLLFYIQGSDFGPLPSPNSIIEFDGKKYRITDAENEMGIYSISMEAIKA